MSGSSVLCIIFKTGKNVPYICKDAKLLQNFNTFKRQVGVRDFILEDIFGKKKAKKLDLLTEQEYSTKISYYSLLNVCEILMNQSDE